jgi:SAM-dependent methyltransferase
MRPIVHDFIADVAEHVDLAEPIVEIGSRPATGQEQGPLLRDIFAGRVFIGCDLFDGPNVDRIEDVHRLSFRDGSVGTVVSVDTLEHVTDPLRAVEEMHRVLQPGGVCAIASVMFFHIHEHPWDYWRFTPEGLGLLLAPFATREVVSHGHPLLPETVMGVGIKGDHAPLDLASMRRTRSWIETWGEGRPIELGPLRLSVGELWRLSVRHTVHAARWRARELLRRTAVHAFRRDRR